MPNRQLIGGEPYRYGYQGEFAETDPETGKPAFELRLYDPRINRWLTPDPYGQHFSPYLGMGNNPISNVDPDGGAAIPQHTLQGLSNLAINISLMGDFFGGFDNFWHNINQIQQLDEVFVNGYQGGGYIFPFVQVDVFDDPDYMSGMTTPPFIFVDPDGNRSESLKQHETGHALQWIDKYKKYEGNLFMTNLDYYYNIGIPSFMNGVENNIEKSLWGRIHMTVDHDYLDVEVDANHRAVHHFGKNLAPDFKENNKLESKEPTKPFYKRWFYYWLFGTQ